MRVMNNGYTLFCTSTDIVNGIEQITIEACAGLASAVAGWSCLEGADPGGARGYARCMAEELRQHTEAGVKGFVCAGGPFCKRGPSITKYCKLALSQTKRPLRRYFRGRGILLVFLNDL